MILTHIGLVGFALCTVLRRIRLEVDEMISALCGLDILYVKEPPCIVNCRWLAARLSQTRPITQMSYCLTKWLKHLISTQ